MTFTARGLLGLSELLLAVALAVVLIRLHRDTRALRKAQRLMRPDTGPDPEMVQIAAWSDELLGDEPAVCERRRQ